MEENKCKRTVVIMPVSMLRLKGNGKESSNYKDSSKKGFTRKLFTPKLKQYIWDDGTDENGTIISGGEYYHSQEPVLRWLLNNDRVIDCVILLATEETHKKKEFVIKNEGKNVKMSLSSCELLQYRFADRKESVGEWCLVNIESDKEKTISKLVSKLEKLKNENDTPLEIVFDIHGGLRDLQNVADDILDLIRMRDGVDVERLTVEFNPSVGKGTVRRVEEMGLELFFAGLKEFLHTGRGSGLSDFFKKKEIDKNISDSISRISDSIALCDMDGFEDALDRFNERWGKPSPKNDRITNMFIQYMKADYGDILDNNKRTVIGEIKWCMNKGLYQQALTLVESRMLGELVNCKRCLINWDWECGEDGETLSEVLEKRGEMWKNPANYLIERVARIILPKNNPVDREPDYLFKTQSIAGNKNSVEELIKRIHPQFRTNILSGKYLRIDYYPEPDNYDRRVQTIIDIGNGKPIDFPNTDQELLDFISLHMWLKEQRNKANHGSDEKGRDGTKNIRSALEKYISLFETVTGVQ